MLRNIMLGVGLFSAILGMLIFSGKISIGPKTTELTGTVTVWGTLPEEKMGRVVQVYAQDKKYRVNYKEVKEDVFSETLVNALANRAGPDMILAPYQIILAQASRIAPIPAVAVNEKKFKDTFIDGAIVLYGVSGPLALPVSVDPMVLFYNRTLFSKNGVATPPKYWDEVSSIVPSMTVAKNGVFSESGIALGAETTPYAKDILMTMVAQLGQVPAITRYNSQAEPITTIMANTPINNDSEIKPLSSAVRYFTQFADPTQQTYSWNKASGNPTDMFVSEKLAMYVGYSGELGTLRARNPRGDFEMTYLPQAKGYNNFTTGMRLYGLAALKNIRYPQVATDVQVNFATGDVAPKIAAVTGGVPALRSYAGMQGVHETIARSMLVARGWNDMYSDESTKYVVSMLSDVLNYRNGVSEAVNIFVRRLTDLYTPY